MLELLLLFLSIGVVGEDAEAAGETPACCRVPARWEVAAAPAAIAVTVEPCEAGAVVRVGDEVFAEYRVDGGHLPAVWPIYGPGGHEMTRSWPLGPLRDGEVDDHPHHRSLWFAHGDVNGHDFWHGKRGEAIAHREFTRVESADGAAVVETFNDWRAGGETVMSDRRTLAFGLVDPASADSPRVIDYEIELVASEGPVTFGDTKEGTFAVRVPGAMKLKAGRGGRVRNSRGQADGDAWGRPAEWVDYSGPLTPDAGGPVGGITLFVRPDAFRPTPRWHVRDYGLFASNPFGKVDFPEGAPTQGAVTLAEGESLTLRYRVVFYAGEYDADAVAGWLASAR